MTGQSKSKGGAAVASPNRIDPKSFVRERKTDSQPETRKAYWLGILHSRTYEDGTSRRAPFFFQNIGAATFQRTWEPIVGTDDTGRQRRAQHDGRIFHLTRAEVEHIADVMGRSIIKWRGRDGKKAHGYMVTLKTDAEREELMRLERFRPVTEDVHDEPAANWFYMVPGEHPGGQIPEPVSKTGIELP